ncbi:MAG TPA: hypothetical protein VF715_03810 [Thermoleophilaceae bacterium]
MFAPLAAVLALLVPAAPAAAQSEPLPEGNSGTGQYVEPVPDAGGDRPAAPGSGDRPRSQLPPGTRADLPGGDEGRILERIVTDPGSGAPEGAAGGSGGGGRDDGSGRAGGAGRDGTVPARIGADEKGALGTLVSAVVDPDNPGLSIVLLAGLGLTLAAGIAAARRRRT